MPLSGWLDSVRGQLIDLPEALKVRVAQEDRPDGIGDIRIAILTRELQSLRVVRVPSNATSRGAAVGSTRL